MTVKLLSTCPDDWFQVQQLIFAKHCYSLPVRWCFSPTPPNSTEVGALRWSGIEGFKAPWNDWFEVQQLIFAKHCNSLPVRWCFSPTPPNSAEAGALRWCGIESFKAPWNDWCFSPTPPEAVALRWCGIGRHPTRQS